MHEDLEKQVLADALADLPDEVSEEEETEDVEDNDPGEQTEDADDIDSVELEAREAGWRPKEEWKGDPKRWVSAEHFVARGKRIDRELKEKNTTLEKKLDAITKENRAIHKALQKTLENQQKTSKADIESRIEALERQRLEAMEEGEIQVVLDIEKQQKALRENAPEPEQIEDLPTSDTPNTDAWLEENPWFDQDEEATAVAVFKAEKLMKSNPSKYQPDSPELLAELDRQMRVSRPDLFDDQRDDSDEGDDQMEDDQPVKRNPRKEKARNISRSKRAASASDDNSKPKTASLPPEAMQAYKVIKANMEDEFPGVEYTLDQYAEQYYNQGE